MFKSAKGGVVGMQDFIGTKFLDQYLIVSRVSGKGAKIPFEVFCSVVELFKKGEEVPTWLDNLFQSLGGNSTWFGRPMQDVLLLRQPIDGMQFGRASYEITEHCNYNCGHCYLGEKHHSALSRLDKLRIIDFIAQSGCLWLQLTGGEPLFDDDFAVVYERAWGLGLLVMVSTNGSIFSPAIGRLFTTMPPYRLAVSVYGASQSSYEALTKTPKSFSKFHTNLRRMAEMGLQVRANIIVTRYNQDELDDMVQMVNELGISHQIFPYLSPKLNGESTIGVAGTVCASRKLGQHHSVAGTQCCAGKTFFHVDMKGYAYICKVERQQGINLLDQGLVGLTELSNIAELALVPELVCRTCPELGVCNTCAPILRRYKASGDIPARVCKYSIDKEVKSC